MRNLIRAVFGSLVTMAFLGGPVSAATSQAVTVAQATQTGTVTGQVTSEGGSTVSSAIILFDGPGTHTSVTTDNSGNYTLSLPSGLYSVTVNKAGFQTGTTQIAVTPSSSASVDVTLTAATLESLNVIGRTSSFGSNTARFNVSTTPTQSLTQQQILIRNTPDLTQVVNELPGVTIPHAASNANQGFIIRGLRYESRTEIDGHPVSSGTLGFFVTNYAGSPLFSQVDLTKGTGLSGPLAGSSGAGVVNLRTPDFTAKDSGFVQGGVDSYGGSFDTLIADVNLLKDNKLSFLFGRSFSGYRGPTYGQNEADGAGFTLPTYGTFAPTSFTNALVSYIADFSDTYDLNAELAKMRYKFSDSTSFQAEFLGLQGGFNPQGGAYGQFLGTSTIPLCRNVSTPSNTVCTDLSSYNSPGAVESGMVGQAVPLYAFFPGSVITENQPNFNAELRTTLGNDTILLRPYTAAINRDIDGTQENRTPGYTGPWYQVTNAANCQVAFTVPSVAHGGAQGPCYAAGITPIAAYIGTSTLPVVFATTSVAPTCTVAVPCYTTTTTINNGGMYGFVSPFSTDEVDHLAGYTFSWIHPAGANTFSVSFDHYFDDTSDFTNDNTPLAAGCTFVLGGGQTNVAPYTAPGSQSTCPLPLLRTSPISVPETFTSVSSLSGTAQLQVLPKVEADLGFYFTNYQMLGQQESPAVLAALTPTYGAANRTNAIPVVLGPLTNSASHFDPHLGLLYRPTRDWAVRFTAGSSIQIPYASLVSGFTTYAQGVTSTTVSAPNPLLRPEELVDLDLGSDWRTPDGTVFSADLYNIVIHNPWINTKQVLCFCTLPGLELVPETFTSDTVNGAQQYAQGVEFEITNEPKVGFGYRINTSFERNYYLDTNPALFGGSPQVFFDGNQFVSTGSSFVSVPYSKGYAEVQYALPNNGLFRIGADYEGPNNSYNAPAFFIFDAGGRINTGIDNIMLGASVENLTSVNFQAQLAKGVEYAGLAPEAGTPSATGYTYTSQQYNTALNVPPPFTIRVTLSKQF